MSDAQQPRRRGRPPKAGAVSAKKRTNSAKRTKKQQGDIIFALDIGTRTVVGVLAEKQEKGFKVLDMETLEHEKRSMTDGQIDDIEAVAQAIKAVRSALEKRNSIKLSRVCIAAAGRALKTTKGSAVCDVSDKASLSAEDLKAAELEAVRATEAKFSEEYGDSAFYCVGHSVTGILLDGYRSAKPEGHRGEKLETEIIAAFLPAYVVESLCSAVDIAGLDVAGLTLEPIAAMNVIVPPELRMINIALCDIGAGTSDVAASRGGSVVAYGMATVAGDEITEAVMQKLLVDFNTAERIKRAEESEIHFTDILLSERCITAEERDTLLEQPTYELSQTICSEILAANGEAPQAVFLAGGGSKLKGLPAMIAKGLGIDESRVAVGRRELMRGITAPKSMNIGTEHATPLGIAVTASDGIRYDFTTISLNGRKIRALDTSRLTVFELTALGGIKPEKLMGRSGASLSFTLDGERVTLRGTPMTPAEISVNGKAAALNSTVRKGDEVTVVFAENGEDAAALLSDVVDISEAAAFTVSLLGKDVTAGFYALINGKTVTADCDIENGNEIVTVSRRTLAELCAQEGVSGELMINGAAASGSQRLNAGDVITAAAPEVQPVQIPSTDGIEIVFNGQDAVFPQPEGGREPIFLDILAAFSDNPTQLLAHSDRITINGKIARLDDKIHGGDEIVIE